MMFLVLIYRVSGFFCLFRFLLHCGFGVSLIFAFLGPIIVMMVFNFIVRLTPAYKKMGKTGIFFVFSNLIIEVLSFIGLAACFVYFIAGGQMTFKQAFFGIEPPAAVSAVSDAKSSAEQPKEIVSVSIAELAAASSEENPE